MAEQIILMLVIHKRFYMLLSFKLRRRSAYMIKNNSFVPNSSQKIIPRLNTFTTIF